MVRIANALDMGEGRARIPFTAGRIDIHSVSAMAIDNVEITSNPQFPAILKIKMSNSAGIYPIDRLLRNKLKGSGLEAYVHVIAAITGETEEKIIDTFEF